MDNFGGWRVVEPLGEGGQSTVFLVRSPDRTSERSNALQEIRNALDRDQRAELAEAIWRYVRPDDTPELGAAKLFKIDLTEDDPEAVRRLQNEIRVLKENRKGLPKLIAENENERWVVTELFPAGSLERQREKYRGTVSDALYAFHSLVATVAMLHNSGYVHRDIKPANVFVKSDRELILGDFGIVYAPLDGARVTTTTERVGPRDYMPPWADMGVRLETVEPNFDVYMLGKLLWCMVSGKLKLPREYHRRPEFDLEKMFPQIESMRLINSIIEQCVVAEPHDCLPSAIELLRVVDESIANLGRESMVDEQGKFRRPCRICGRGHYRVHIESMLIPKFAGSTGQDHPIHLRVFICNVCAHYEFFAPGFPEEAAHRGWRANV